MSEESFETIANLCFIFDGDEVLLIKKKRGVGEGLYNGPGGKIEEGETAREAAIREVKEETKLKVKNLQKTGELEFYFGEKPFMRVHVFKTSIYSGEPSETEEARPEWFKTDDMPLEEMWPDDKYWIPLMLENKEFAGTFYFDEDGDKILDYDLEKTSF